MPSKEIVARLFNKHGGPVPNEGWCLNESGLNDFLTELFAASPAAPAQSAEPVDYDRVVSICDAHGIALPVDCIEMVVEIIRHAARQSAQTADYALTALTEQQKVDRDLLLYGKSFMLDGKHIPAERVTFRLAGAAVAGDAKTRGVYEYRETGPIETGDDV